MHPETVCDILVFKTSIREEGEVALIAYHLNNHNRIKRWNVDRQDVDHVLRIESDRLHTSEVIDLVQGFGFDCEELPD